MQNEGFKNFLKLLKFDQSGEFLPNLVTLFTTCRFTRFVDVQMFFTTRLVPKQLGGKLELYYYYCCSVKSSISMIEIWNISMEERKQ